MRSRSDLLIAVEGAGRRRLEGLMDSEKWVKTFDFAVRASAIKEMRANLPPSTPAAPYLGTDYGTAN